MTSDETPGFPEDTADERELLLNWLRYLRGAVIRKVDGLTEEQARWTPDGALIPLLGVVVHLTGVEWRWIDGGMLGQPVSRSEAEFTPGPGLTVDAALAAYRERAAATEATARSLPLTAPCRRGEGRTRDLRWVLLHLVNETARHAGHADATRELLDGTTGEWAGHGLLCIQVRAELPELLDDGGTGVTEQSPATGLFSGTTGWARSLETPLRQFLRTETGSAAILLAATIAALVWANADPAGYDAWWRTELSIRAGHAELGQDLREWVNHGLMAFFFLVAGLEARREFDMGELRKRRRLALPVVAGLGGMVVPIAIYLAINAGRGTAGGWGIAASTDTAFALGMLALVGRRLPDRVRTYLLTFAIVDDLVGIAIIAFVYSGRIDLPVLLAGVAVLGLALVARRLDIRNGGVYALAGVAAWVLFFKSGVDPIVVGLIMGLLTVAHPAARQDLEQATESFRQFREQPTPELAEAARQGVRTAISPNDRLQQLFHSWTSYVIVPLFALANAGVAVNGDSLARAFSSPVTLGILLGYVVGKPVGTVASAWLLERLSGGRVRPPVGWAAVTAAGTIAGIGFTVSLLIASLAFTGTRLQDAKVGILAAALGASAVTWAVVRLTSRLPRRLRIRALLGTAETVVDLAVPVDDHYDHIRGPEKSPVTVVEYGDFECPFCGEAEPVIRELLADYGDVHYVWRHLPLTDVHPHAQLAAEGSEAAARQGKFWEMHDLLLAHQGALTGKDLVGYARDLGLDPDRFTADLRRHEGTGKIASDVDSADLSGVSGTPTFFINGMRHHGAYDIESLAQTVRSARAKVGIGAKR